MKRIVQNNGVARLDPYKGGKASVNDAMPHCMISSQSELGELAMMIVH